MDVQACQPSFEGFPEGLGFPTCGRGIVYIYVACVVIELLFVFVKAVFVAARSEELGIAT